MNVLKSLADYYDRLKVASVELPKEDFALNKIHAEIVLSQNGEFLDFFFIGGTDKKSNFKEYYVPYHGRSGATPPSYFTWDKANHALGINLDKAGATVCGDETMERHLDFKKLHDTSINEDSSDDLRALKQFLNEILNESVRNSICKKIGNATQMNVVFKIDGRDSYLHDLPEVQDIWKNIMDIRYPSNLAGTCMVSGKKNVALARLHPVIKGIRGAKGMGDKLVSYNDDIYNSHNMESGENASVSTEISRKYGVALNRLLERQSTQKTYIGDMTVVFWAETSNNVNSRQAEASENIFSKAIDMSKDTDETAVAELRNSMKRMAEGRMDKNLAPDLNPDTVINILGISPNNARLSVRFWHRGQFGNIARNLTEHWDSLEFSNKRENGWKNPPPIWSLVCSSALNEDSKKVHPLFAGQLFESVLNGKQFPRSFMQAVIRRIQSEDVTNDKGYLTISFKKRASICKAFAVRTLKSTNNKECNLMELDKNNTKTAYLLGRLFACFAHAERNYDPGRNATISDKFLKSASKTPTTVFPMLFNRYQHTQSALRKRGHGSRVDQEIEEIISKFEGDYNDYPKTLDLDNQALFFTGFYHQRPALFTSLKSEEMVDSNPNDENNVNESETE